LIYMKLLDFVKPRLNDSQFGFLQGKSTSQQLLSLYHDIFSSVGSQSQWDVIYLDFAKAFDSVPHSELLVKLRSVGISGSLWGWLHSYLHGRQ